MRRVQITVPVPELLFALASSVAPVLGGLRAASARAWIRYRTWGLHPSHPDYARYARRMASLRGGVRI